MKEGLAILDGYRAQARHEQIKSTKLQKEDRSEAQDGKMDYDTGEHRQREGTTDLTFGEESYNGIINSTKSLQVAADDSRRLFREGMGVRQESDAFWLQYEKVNFQLRHDQN